MATLFLICHFLACVTIVPSQRPSHDQAPNSAAPPIARLSQQTIQTGRAVLEGRKGGPLAFLAFLGPALIASIAYMDPGNFATNVEAGAKLDMKLLWVVLIANIIAMMFQALSAKLGLVTDKSLAHNCRLYFPRSLVLVMWVLGECAAMATDLAEFLGAALGLSLLMHISLMQGLIITALTTWLILHYVHNQFRAMEYIIAGFIALIGVSYFIEVIMAAPPWDKIIHGLIPSALDTDEALTLSVSIIGATVMPHALYLHSYLTQNRIPAHNDGERRRLISYSHREIIIALGLAGLVNLAMVIMSAQVFHPHHSDVADIATAYLTLDPLLGATAAVLFLIALIASGLSSSIVGTLAGQSMMQDFVHFSIPLWLRRALTMLPAFAVVLMGYQVTQALIISQVILSLLLPLPMLSLIWLCAQKKIMGPFVLSMRGLILSLCATGLIMALNFLLVASALRDALSHPF